MSGSIPENAVHHLATVTVQLSQTLLASGNVSQSVVTAAAAPRTPSFQLFSSPVFNNHSTLK